jgi:hypothetical protein
MYVAEITSKSKGKKYQCVLLRESYRVGGKVKTRTIANLSHCKPQEIEAIKIALAHKEDLSQLGSLANDVKIEEGPSVGAVWTVLSIARGLGIETALGTDRAGKLAMWQVIARVIDQGSRLSAVRLAGTHAACDALGLRRGFSEKDLYENLGWLEKHQASIEKRLFKARLGGEKPQLFLYDVTSSYLEGEQNELGGWGYNRDKKRGKKQIVVGLLCDDVGAPVSIEVFRGNTHDLATFAPQVRKVAQRFGCRGVTFVGDRGMIKSAQIEQLGEENFHFISALTKPQVETLLARDVIQLDLFDENVCEVQSGPLRYILRRNPVRAEQVAATRRDKQAGVLRFLLKKNRYLQEHPRARVEVAQRNVAERIAHLRIDGWLRVEIRGRGLSLVADNAALARDSRLDGCYVIRTDLPAHAADAQTVHDRYKDLADVERAFRTCKTAHLEMRPIYVRRADNTRAHALVVMLAYLVVRELRRAWANLDTTVEEGLGQLATLSTMRVRVRGGHGGGQAHKIPRPRASSRRLLEAAGVRLPSALPSLGAYVVTKRKLPQRRVKP